MRVLETIVAASFLLFSLTGVLNAQNVSEKQARINRLEKEIAILDRQIKDNASKNADAMARLSLVRTKMASRQELLRESEKEIAAIDERIREKQKEIDKLEARLDTMQAYCGRLALSAFKNRDARVWYLYILASDNVSQGFRRYRYFKSLSSQMYAQAVKIRESKEKLEEERAAMKVMLANATKLRNQRSAELASLKVEEKQAQTLTANLKKQKSKYQKDISAKRRQADSLEKEIRNAIKGAMGSSNSSSKGSAKIDYKLADQFVANKGILPWPVEGALTGHFGKQYHSVFKNLQLPANNGINVAVSPDSKVKSVFNGTVAQISVLPGYHQCILVQHGNFFTLYAKMKTVNVKNGEKVTTGQVLGTVDTISGETVFHFEIWDDHTIPQDPELWLREK